MGIEDGDGLVGVCQRCSSYAANRAGLRCLQTSCKKAGGVLCYIYQSNPHRWYKHAAVLAVGTLFALYVLVAVDMAVFDVAVCVFVLVNISTTTKQQQITHL